ncbi:COG3628 Phage baseplate assembly protein W [uncultured Caudovirales phage]|uniref:COG3628 Phage baseplate assembly protein W n=1 Tax=uncultured Caudovirales phage TaxID=2100421 RepID=A0A6J5LKV7_9CAUD|nr:COG3628 Phage baseplate assembly protein W [uncultured Caudovirales phage]
MTSKYRGFSTSGRTKKFKLTDIELVKQDLINHFSIRKGEKLMQPDFGSIIWNTLFETMTSDVQAAIVEDIKRIANYDPRINVTNVLVNELDNGLQIQLDILYLQANYSDKLTLNFNSDKTLTTA